MQNISEKQFPILSHSKEKEYIPWSALKDCDYRAMNNHGGQNLERLAQRGGLSWPEVLAVLENRDCRIFMDHETYKAYEIECKRKVLQMISMKCVICGSVLTWGGFAYNQEMCWDCFKNEIGVINMKLNISAESFDECEKQTEIINWLVACLAEKWGFE